MQKGFVALLDVLGFSALVSSETGSDRLQRYLECLQNVFGMRSGVAADVDYVVFSDSIVLTGKGDSEASLQALVQQCSKLFGAMLENEFALRGAIAYGSYLRAEGEGGIFVAGNPIIEAYRYETAQDWVGIMLSPSVVKRMPNLASLCALRAYSTKEQLEDLKGRLDWAPFVQPSYNIPFHGTNFADTPFFHGFAVLPTNGSNKPSDVRNSLRVSVSGLSRLKSIAPNPDAQAKYSRSSQFLENVLKCWDTIVYSLDRYSTIAPDR